MKTTKLKQLVIATIVGAQFTRTGLAAEATATGTNGTAVAEIPAFAADTGSAAEAAETRRSSSRLRRWYKK